ncbi:hypothetical protein [Paraburkholderia diazotrophica]|uniref:hypothetical protein n=1 Tax=Paraburkholderia diazotrophica TaxID=667676 RepID=UPI000B86BE2D|nr:hypothetical protein [Paraburkholderia diazotrophica]
MSVEPQRNGVWKIVRLGDFQAAETSLDVAPAIFTLTIGPSICLYCYIAFLLARQGRLVGAPKKLAWIDTYSLEAYRDCLLLVAARCYEETFAMI